MDMTGLIYDKVTNLFVNRAKIRPLFFKFLNEIEIGVYWLC